MNKKPKSCVYRIAAGFLVLLLTCLLFATITALSNRNLPGEDHSDKLSAVDKARLLETLHLKTTLGDKVWQGWGSADIPVLVWNRSYEFLVNYNGVLPSDWSRVPNDELNGKPYFRRQAKEPQNFAMRVGDTWAASMATKQTTDVFLIKTFQDVLPMPIKQVFPYRLLLQPSETQIGGLLHETFHVYQYQISPERIAKAESIHKLGDQYEAASEKSQTEWKKESVLLADALKAKTRKEKVEFVRQFLTTREARRKDYGFSADFVNYERWLEWEEGTAKYVEVAILKQANVATNYQVLPAMENDSDFKRYQNFKQRWAQELLQLRYQTSSGEIQFYMTGMAQAFLLDDLMSGWKEKYWNDNTFLEDLLREAIAEYQ
jgi:hypothetical protein